MARTAADKAGGYLDVGEAADFLHLGARKVYDLVARGELPHTRAGAKILFEREALRRWLAGRASGAGSSHPLPATVAGSHDPLLEWAVRESRCGLALLTAGSGDGIERLIAGEACAALLHVPAPDLSDFNRHVAATRFAGRDIALVAWAHREQGLLVARGNPKRIRAIAQLGAKGVRVALRQEGSGSHALLERLLAREGLRLSQLNARGDPAMSETDLAAAIQLERADVGLGARAAAKLAGLDFVPLLQERVDLAVRRSAWFDPPLQALASFARGRRFSEHAAALGGYDVTALGTPVWNG